MRECIFCKNLVTSDSDRFPCPIYERCANAIEDVVERVLERRERR